MGILINKRLVSSFSGYATISVMSRLSLWTTFLIKERGRTSFAAFGEGRSKKRPIPVLNANELLKKTRQCYYTKSHGKNATKRRNICSQNLRYHSSFIVIFLFKRATNEVDTMGLRIACIFVKIYVVELIIWCSYFGSQEIQITDPICAMWYRGTEFQFAIFWPLIIRAWNQIDLEHIQLDWVYSTTIIRQFVWN